jgi:hypothetical protein
MKKRSAKARRTRNDRTNEAIALSRINLVPVTAEELHFAATAATAAASGQTPRQSFLSKYEEAVEAGKVDPKKPRLVLRDDIPDNHMAFAIMDAFPEKTPEGDLKRQSLLWRVMRALPMVLKDPRAQSYVRDEKDGRSMIATPLIDAIATTPMIMGEAVPIDQIFTIAAHFVAIGRGRHANPRATSS